MSAVGDARKRHAGQDVDWGFVHGDCARELAETMSAALDTANADLLRLAAELATAHTEIDTLRKQALARKGSKW